jgi:hypothetical protein
MSDHKFDRLLSEIRNANVEDSVVDQAGERVWGAITASQSTELSMHNLRSCEDFQALIPEYLGKNLPESRRLLFEDHLHQCVTCRHAVKHARRGELQPVWMPKPPRSVFPIWRWAMGATAAVAIGVSAVALANGFFPGQHAVRGSVCGC